MMVVENESETMNLIEDLEPKRNKGELESHQKNKETLR